MRMKGKYLMRALLGGAMLLSPVAALAGIDNSHHDIPYMDTTVKEKCAYCHAVVMDPAALPAGPKGALKKVGSFCVVVCHMTGTALTTNRPQVVPTSTGSFGAYSGSAVDVFDPLTLPTHPTYGLDGTIAMTLPADYNIVGVLTNGHGMDKTLLTGINANEVTAMEATLWPHTAAGQDMQCTSCHAVHDSTNPPFLNAQLNNFCQSCHNDAGRQQAFGSPGDHPTNFMWDVAAANGRNRDLGPIGGVTNLNRVVSGTWADGTDKATFTASKTNSWTMGGHLLENTYGMPVTSAFATNRVTCVTCHIVHENEGGGTGQFGDTLTVGNDIETVCYGCHSIEPGRTGKGHPIGQETVRSAASHSWKADLDSTLSAGYAAINSAYAANATTEAPTCVTCHDVHGAAVGRMAIRNIGTYTDYVTTPASVCDACHTKSFSSPDGGNDKHHPGQATGKNYNADNAFPASAAWSTADGNGDLTDGLSCQDCHVGNGTALTNSTAHNW